MSVILISITESPIQIISGIPRSIVIDTNVPATVFYTLDGTQPTLDSQIAVGAVMLPTDLNTVYLNLFATDGVDSSPIITYVYGTNQIGLRQSHFTVNGINPISDYNNNRSFGSESLTEGVSYGNIGGVIVEKEWVAGIPDGYDGTATGTVAVEPLESYHRDNYDIVYSTTNWLGETGRGIGNLPANVVIERPPVPPVMSNANNALFDPKALVIIQDGREPSENPPMINRQFFFGGDQERIKNGIMYNTTGWEGSAPTGSLIKPQYNPKDNTYTFYYRDSETNRWIMSIEPVNNAPVQTAPEDLVFPQGTKVFKWIPFKRTFYW